MNHSNVVDVEIHTTRSIKYNSMRWHNWNSDSTKHNIFVLYLRCHCINFQFSILCKETCLDMLKKKLTRTDGWLKISSNGSRQFTLHIREQWQMSSSSQSFYKKCNNHWKHQYKYSTTWGHKFLVIPLWSVLMDIYWITH